MGFDSPPCAGMGAIPGCMGIVCALGPICGRSGNIIRLCRFARDGLNIDYFPHIVHARFVFKPPDHHPGKLQVYKVGGRYFTVTDRLPKLLIWAWTPKVLTAAAPEKVSAASPELRQIVQQN